MVLLRRLLRLFHRLRRDPGVQGVLIARALVLALTCGAAGGACAAEQPLTLCYRTDAAPFSYEDEAGRPAGYSVDLCRLVADGMGQSDPAMIAVTSNTRFDRLGRDCRLLCEATTLTLARRETMEFSLITFLTATALLYPVDLPAKGQKDAAVLKVGFLQRTTTDDLWQQGDLVGGADYRFEFQPVESHDTAARMLGDGTLDAYIADREILEVILAGAPALADRLHIGQQGLTYEPYALAVARGDDDLLIQVDRVLVGLFRSGKIREILGRHVPHRRFDPLLTDLFRIQSIPD